MMNHLIRLIIILSLIASCKSDDETTSASQNNSPLQFFGFTLIDTYWDDPTDNLTKSNYADEIESFSNIADILVVNDQDDLNDRVAYFAEYELKVILHLNELFFEQNGNNSPSGINYDLRTDYIERWQQFKNVNQVVLTPELIGTFYIGEEPTWNGITFSELNQVAEILELDYPTIPKMIVEAYPSLTDLQIPETVDWIGFDRYFVKDPNTNPEYLSNWETLKTKISNPMQKMVVIMDSHYIEWAHGDFGNISFEQMGEVANAYYNFAKNEEKTIALLGYFWPNGFDFPESIGARGMTESTKSVYSSIGKEITGKNN